MRFFFFSRVSLTLFQLFLGSCFWTKSGPGRKSSREMISYFPSKRNLIISICSPCGPFSFVRCPLGCFLHEHAGGRIYVRKNCPDPVFLYPLKLRKRNNNSEHPRANGCGGLYCWALILCSSHT